MVMMDVLHMPEESTTVYRVVLTALPMSVAIVFSAIENKIFVFCLCLNFIEFNINSYIALF